jgi:hypothetical protein
MSGVTIGKKKKKSKDYDNDNDNDNESTSESAYYYNDYPKLYFAIRKGRYTNNTICINWDDAQREIKDYHYAEYIATPTLIQATKYVNRLGEFEMTRTKSKSKSKSKATVIATKSSRSSHRPLTKRTCYQISSSQQQQAVEAKAEQEGSYDLNSTTISTTISSSPRTHNNNNSRTDNTNKKMKKNKKKRQSLESKTKSKTKETTTTATTADEKTTRKQPNKSKPKSGSSKTRKLLLEYYQLINPNISKDNQLKIDEFLLSRGMLKRKKVMFTKHWNHSGLVIMCNENCDPYTAIERYDDWIEQRRFDKYNDSDNDNDRTVDDSTRISTPSRKRKRKSSSRPVIMLTTADDDIPVDTDDDDDDILVDTEDEDDDDDENVSQDNINNKKKPNPTTTTTKKKRRSTTTTAATSTSLSSSSSLSSSLEVSPAALEEVVVVTAAERVKNKRRLSYDAAKNGDNNNNNNDDKNNNENHQLQQENTEDDDEAWNEMYTELQKFYQEHNHCKVTSKSDRTIIGKQDGIKKSLQYWVSYQQRRMRPNVINRSGARSLSLREELLLNELKFIPNFIEVQNEFKQYLAHGITRIGKAFEVFDDDGTIKKSVYFGTIDHISSITNRVS